MTDLLAACRARTDEITALLTTLIEYETFTTEKAAVDSFATALTGMLQALGASVERMPRETVGDILLAKWNAEAAGRPITFVGHMDTVWPLGTLAERPVRVAEGRLYGPGSIDMKAGLAVLLSAVRVLQEADVFPARPVWALFTSDEEIGSPNSREIIMEVARQSGLCVILEPTTPEGAIKTWRKGVSDYHISVTGRSSHAGGAPEAGINAVVELAHQIVRINELNDLRNGTSVSVTVVKGGHATNVIPDHAEAYVDVRFLKPEEMERIRAGMEGLYPRLPGAQLSITTRDARPPLERNEQMRQSFQRLKAIGESIGLSLYEDGSGGGSDGNFTAAVGTPTLDGMGPTGEGLHALHEHVLISSLPEKTALLAALLQQWPG